MLPQANKLYSHYPLPGWKTFYPVDLNIDSIHPEMVFTKHVLLFFLTFFKRLIKYVDKQTSMVNRECRRFLDTTPALLFTSLSMG